MNEKAVMRVLSFFKKYRLFVSFVIALSAATSLLTLITPLLMKQIIDQVIPDKDIHLLFLICGSIFVIIIVSGLLGIWQNHLENIVGQRIMKDIRTALIENLHLQSISFFTQSRSGEIIHRLTADIQMIQSVVTRTIVSAMTQSLFWLSAVVILFVLDYRLAIFSLLLLPLYITPSRRAARRRKKVMQETQKMKSKLSVNISEAFGISGVLLTRIFGREKNFHNSSTI